VFALMLFPVLGFFRMFYFRYSPVADHWAYLALPALLALFAAQPWRRELLCALAALACGVLSFQRAGLFQNQLRVWEDAAAKNPRSWLAHWRIATGSMALGDSAKAVEHLRTALAIEPSLAEARFELGVTLLRTGGAGEAIAQFEHAITLKPNYVEALVNLGITLADVGRLDEGIARVREAIVADPGSAQAFNNLGWLLIQKGDSQGAIGAFRRAVEINPGYEKARANLAQALARQAGEKAGDQ
jgi:tetratricopeptide (TPR) repeat protein